MVDYPTALSYIGYGAETSFGAGATPTTAIQGKVTNFTPNFNNNMIVSRGVGDGRNVTSYVYGNFSANGSVAWEPTDNGFDFLVHSIGTRSGAGTSGDPYLLNEADTVVYSGTGIKSCAMAYNTDASSDVEGTVTGVLINDFTVNFAVGAKVTATANWIGKTVTFDTSPGSITADTGNPWVGQQATLKWGSTPTAETRVQNASITMSNNWVETRSLGSRFTTEPAPGERRYNFTVTTKLNSSQLTTMRDDFLGQANSPVSGTGTAVTNLELKLELASGSKGAYIWLDKCQLFTMSDPIPLGGGWREVTFTGEAQEGKSNAPIAWWTS